MRRERVAIAVLGGGSVWTPCLVDQLAKLTGSLHLEVRLHGPTLRHLHEIASFARSRLPAQLELAECALLEDAVDGTRIVIQQARIGGWAARVDDESVPVEFGAVGDESQGWGGLRAAARTWPFVRQVVAALRQRAPEAWLLNLTNPSDLVSGAFRHAGWDKTISLCDHPQELAAQLASLVGRPRAAPRFRFLGMNHVGWLIPPREIPLSSLAARRPDLLPWIRDWQAIPTPWRILMAHPQDLLRRQRRAPGERARHLEVVSGKLREAIRDQDEESYDELLQERYPSWYARMVVPTVRGLLGMETVRLIVGLPNGERLDGLSTQVQIESWATIDASGVKPRPLPTNGKCREDVARFGRSRALAFAAMVEPSVASWQKYACTDAFARSAAADPSLLFPREISMAVPRAAAQWR